MIEIKDTLVSLDLVERYFCCDLEACKGQCCIEGDAGAPLAPGENEKIRGILSQIWDDLLPAAQRRISEDGVSYTDIEGDEVTMLIDGGLCAFATIAPDGSWRCAIENACRQGRISFLKPVSCHLYPVRLARLSDGRTAVNFHRWRICRAAETLGRAKNIRAYQFLEGPLRRHFGDEWYDELAFTAGIYLQQTGK